MTTTEIGQEAEQAVCRYLCARNYEILDQNWKTKTCEIDVVAKKNGTVFFIEVKYRKFLAQGDGFDYITPAKVKQMSYAASLWVYQNSWYGGYELIGASVIGATRQIAFNKVISH